jgi:DNA (cytosine-5)-methyltransferase 3A
MNVLSLFDGISCGQIALQRAEIKYDNYFASEIDNYTINVTQANYPKTIQLGDITKIKKEDLPNIDLMMGGSPCQGFSFAGKMLNFDDSRSKLFFDFVRLLNDIKPKYFLLENVKMKSDWVDIISNELKVKPILINSNLVSAQNRPRLYWTNIPVSQPLDKHIYLSDILEDDVDSKYFLNNIPNEILQYNLKSVMFTERRTEEAKQLRKEYREKYNRDFCPRRMKELAPRTDNKANCLTTFLTKESIIIDKLGIVRYLTPIEAERLQTLPDNYTELLSDKNRYKSIGNGWTVNVIAHILKNIK